MAHVGVSGLFETHLTVADLERSVTFYREVVGLEVAHRADAVGAAFLWIGGAGRSMLGLWDAGRAPNAMRLHVAFACAPDDVLTAPERLRSAGVTPLGFDGEPSDEPVVIGWMPAVSVFFADPDGHMLEYLAMLDADARPDLGVVTYSAWAARRDG